MGTPDFSVPALKILAAKKDFHICLVVTQPDRPKGRGKKVTPPPVKTAALELGIPVIQPEKINTEETGDLLLSHEPDYFVVAAFGQILSQDILDIPKKYPVNIHASLLPKYRGAAPIQAAVANMDTEAGVTTMVMEKGMDTGPMLLSQSIPLPPEYTAQDLHEVLSLLGADLIVETIDKLNANDLTPILQDDSRATYAPMLKKSHGNIDWETSARKIVAHINAMTPWPGAFTFLNQQRIKIFKAIQGEPQKGNPAKSSGEIFHLSSQGIHVAAGENSVIITELMSPSGKRLAADAFLRGNPILLPARFHRGHDN